MKRISVIFILTMIICFNAFATEKYSVQASVNDENFIINNEKYSAKTYCFNINKGDEVIFIEGSANGTCASAKFMDLTTNTSCDVWCD